MVDLTIYSYRNCDFNGWDINGEHILPPSAYIYECDWLFYLTKTQFKNKADKIILILNNSKSNKEKLFDYAIYKMIDFLNRSIATVA